MTHVKLFERMQRTQARVIERLKASNKRDSLDPYPGIGRELENLIQFMKSCKIDPDTDDNFKILIDTLVKTISREKYIGVDTLMVWVLCLLDKYNLHETMWFVYQEANEKCRQSLLSFLPDHYKTAAVIMK